MLNVKSGLARNREPLFVVYMGQDEGIKEQESSGEGINF